MPVLTVPDFSRPFKIKVDASTCGAGVVFLHEEGQGIDFVGCGRIVFVFILCMSMYKVLQV